MATASAKSILSIPVLFKLIHTVLFSKGRNFKCCKKVIYRDFKKYTIVVSKPLKLLRESTDVCVIALKCIKKRN